MKKIIFAMILLLAVSSIFAQSVLDNTGEDWVKWTSMEKEKYVLGWMSSLSTLRALLFDLKENGGGTKDQYILVDSLATWALYSGYSVADIVLVLNRAYSDASARKYKIWDVVLTSFDKEWW